jgi:hypothetical protein
MLTRIITVLSLILVMTMGLLSRVAGITHSIITAWGTDRRSLSSKAGSSLSKKSPRECRGDPVGIKSSYPYDDDRQEIR